MTTYTKADFGHADDPHFDLDKAIEATEWVLAHPDEAEFVVAKMLFDNTAFYMIDNEAPITAAVEGYIAKRLDEVKLAVSRRVEKSAAAGELLRTLEEISKAAEDDGVTDYDKSQRVKNQWRDSRGRFRVMNRQIVEVSGKKPLHSTDFARRSGTGRKGDVAGLSGSRLATYQADYLQVVRALQDLDAEHGGSEVTVRAKYSDGTVGPSYSLASAASATRNGHNNQGLLPVEDYRNGKRVERVEAFSENGAPLAGDRTLGMDALTAMTRSPGFADAVYGAGGAAANGLGGLLDSSGYASSDAGVNDRMWRRLGASSKLANDTLGRHLPKEAQFALKVGEWAGQYAPEAEKVIGPSARRASYRYRGVEKTPSPVYQRDIDQLRHEASSGRQAHEWLLQGRPLPATRPGQKVMRQESATIQALKDKLPDPGLYELNRKSGQITPSQGILIDRTGKVVTEAVGYADDWYLPFNLKNLSRLKGGEYIRTRGYGGLTTEDIYAGLVGGARSVTVVSHSGVYTIEFDDDFRGSRRFNDKAARMVGRYGQLLDAVKSEDVSLGEQTPARMEELRIQAGRETGLDPERDATEKEYRDALRKLKDSDRRNPVLAEADKNAAILQALNEEVINRDLAPGTSEYLARAMREGRLTGPQVEALRADPIALAKELGMTRVAMDAAESARMVNEQNLNPLRLNARGYEAAMAALQQQFPYYIKDVTFQGGPITGANDKGYIKPKFNRPEEAYAGYYDPTIEGHSKIRADRTDYQNFDVVGTPGNPRGPRQNRIFVDREEEPAKTQAVKETAAGAGAAKAKEPSADFKLAQQMGTNQGWIDLATWVQAQQNFGPNAKDPAGNDFGGKAINGQNLGFGALMMDPTALAAALNDPTTAPTIQRKLKADLDKITNTSMFDVPANIASKIANPDTGKTAPVPDSTLQLLNGIGNTNFEFKDLTGRLRGADYYSSLIGSLVGKYPDFQAPQRDGVPVLSETTDAASAKQAIALIKSRLSDDARAWAYHNEDSANPAGAIPEAYLHRMATDLAKLSQAYQMRDRVSAGTTGAASPAAAPPEEAGPKAEAPAPQEKGAADTDLANQLIATAKPYQDKIRSMVGMDDVADQVDGLVAQAIAAKRREAAGLPVDDRPMHMVFTGNPGVGKTTVARIIAPLYHDLGLTATDTLTEVKSPSELFGSYSNQTRENTLKFLEAHKGGVIFIDEAHQLASDKEGRQALETMVPWSSNNRDTVIILAGYPEHMRRFFEYDPGLSSRFPQKIGFKDYGSAEMGQIADSMLESKGYTVKGPARAAIQRGVVELAATDHANGRSVETLINRARQAQELRLMHKDNPTPAQLSELTTADVQYGLSSLGLHSRKKRSA